MKRVVMTGATSMIAVACMEACLAGGTEVLAIVRPDSGRLSRLPSDPRIRVVECDLGAMDSLQINEHGFDAFFHFAWEATSHQARIDPVAQERNILHALDAVRLASRMGCKKFVGAGSQAEYGPPKGILGPDSPARPIMAYGVAKFAAGALCAIECRRLNLRFNWARIFSVYGPYDNEHALINTLLDHLERGQAIPLTACEQMWDYLYASDCGRALRLIAERGTDQAVYCVGSGVARPLREYLAEIGRCYRTDLTPWMGKIPYAPDQVMHLCADIRSLTEDTGFVPEVDFARGIESTIRHKRGVAP